MGALSDVYQLDALCIAGVVLRGTSGAFQNPYAWYPLLISAAASTPIGAKVVLHVSDSLRRPSVSCSRLASASRCATHGKTSRPNYRCCGIRTCHWALHCACSHALHHLWHRGVEARRKAPLVLPSCFCNAATNASANASRRRWAGQRVLISDGQGAPEQASQAAGIREAWLQQLG